MPEEIRARIKRTIASTYPSDWAPLGLWERSFKVEYFCYWNWYCEAVSGVFSPSGLLVCLYVCFFKGVSAPQGVHPDKLMWTSYSGPIPAPLRVPYLSKDIRKDGGIVYRQLGVGLSIVFDWISEQVSLSPLNKHLC